MGKHSRLIAFLFLWCVIAAASGSLAAVDESNIFNLMTRRQSLPFEGESNIFSLLGGSGLSIGVRGVYEEVPAEASTRLFVVRYDDLWNHIDTTNATVAGMVHYSTNDISIGQTNNFEIYYEGINAFDTLGELWASRSITTETEGEMYWLDRVMPYVSKCHIDRQSTQNIIYPQDSINTGEVVYAVAEVINQDAVSRDVRITLALDRAPHSLGLFDVVYTSAYESVPAGGTNIFQLDNIALTSEGFYSMAVYTESIKDSIEYKTDSWDWTGGFSVSNAASPYLRWGTIVLSDGRDYGLYARLASGGVALKSFYATDELSEEGVCEIFLTTDPFDMATVLPKAEYLELGLDKAIRTLFERVKRRGDHWLTEPVRSGGDLSFIPLTGGFWKLEWKWSDSSRREAYRDKIRHVISFRGLTSETEYGTVEDGLDKLRVDAMSMDALVPLDEMIDIVVSDPLPNGLTIWQQLGLTPIATADLTSAEKLKLIGVAAEKGMDVLSEVVDNAKHRAFFSKAASIASHVNFAMDFKNKVAASTLLDQYLSSSIDAKKRLDSLESAYYYYLQNVDADIDDQVIAAIQDVRDEAEEDSAFFADAIENALAEAVSWDSVANVLSAVNSYAENKGARYVSHVASKIAATIHANKDAINISKTKLDVATASISTIISLSSQFHEKRSEKHNLSACMTLNEILIRYIPSVERRIAYNDVYDLYDFGEINRAKRMNGYITWSIYNDYLVVHNVAPEDWIGHATDIGLQALSAKANFGIGLVAPVVDALNSLFISVGNWIWSNDIGEMKSQLERLQEDEKVYAEHNSELSMFLANAYLGNYEAAVHEYVPNPLNLGYIPDLTLVVGDTMFINLSVGGLSDGETANYNLAGGSGFASIVGSMLALEPDGAEDVGSHSLTLGALTSESRETNITFSVTIEGVPAPTGSVSVVAVTSALASAEWCLDGESSWIAAGDVATGLETGQYTIAWRQVEGWIAPTSKVVNLSAGSLLLVTGEYTRVYHDVQISSGLGGSVGPSGVVSVAHGDSVSFGITNSSYYECSSVSVGGAVVDENSWMTGNFLIENVTSNLDVVVTFRPQTTSRGTSRPWLDAFGLNIKHHEFEDVMDRDLDGMQAWQEYIAGTSPTDLRDYFCVKSVSGNTNSSALTIEWNGVIDRLYTVYGYTNIQDMSSPDLLFQTYGDGGTMFYTNALDEDTRFFRLGVEIRP